MKKTLKKILATTVKLLRCEFLLILIKRPYLLPRASSYTHPTFRIVKRHDVYFKLDLSDMMQWQVFANVNPDLSRHLQSYLSNKSIILDVGANCGEFCLKVAHFAYRMGYLSLRIYAFEPNPIMVSRLEENLSLNEHLRRMIVIVPKALSDTIGLAPFKFEYSHTGAGRLGEDTEGNSIQVNVTSLDEYIREGNIPYVTFIKIDVEGFEGNVLCGGISVFNRFFPGCHIEVTDKWLVRNSFSKEFIYEFFEKRGYTIKRQKGDKFVPLRSSGFDLRRQHNILCVK